MNLLASKELTDEINHERKIVDSFYFRNYRVEEAIRDYRDDIKKTISQALSKLTQEQNIELITMLAQNLQRFR